MVMNYEPVALMSVNAPHSIMCAPIDQRADRLANVGPACARYYATAHAQKLYSCVRKCYTNLNACTCANGGQTVSKCGSTSAVPLVPLCPTALHVYS